MQIIPIDAETKLNAVTIDKELEEQISGKDDTTKRTLDFYVIGRIWIETLKAVLVGAKLSLIPVVNAAPPPPPQKPPPMKYTDLPIYKSPHYEYKDYMKDKEKCPDVNVRMLHQLLLPYVTKFRKQTIKTYCQTKCSIICNYRQTKTSFCSATKDFKKMMRADDNLALRQAVVAVGGATGYCIGCSKGIPRRMFFTGLGTLAAGALCFPKETDEAFRTFVHHTGKYVVAFYNNYCKKHFELRERLPCKPDMPLLPKTRKPNPFPKK